ncbi:MAG: sulfurtransferase [Gammaproteobacteria bacterium HGW-Gammaproteobacteria-1]|jgi:rhodanese-related sulfurtransferase|nr:MAG: sulfurtransferase [Gammaproteobacteria bacterium HGW-Gammaproteobacteria-1]
MFNFREIEIFDVKRMLEGEGKSVRLIDVRSPMEVVSGIIPGATNIPLHMLPMSVEKIPDDSEVVIYCRTGARSAQACAYLTSLGKDNVYNLRGGIMAWLQGGLAVA